MQREQMLQRLAEPPQVWDLLVIGGGATGIGVAWNAAARGYRTLLLEAHDFAHGTSSRSTKLIHGGVRYLRQGEIGMVRSALHEREYLLRQANPLVWPLQLVMPSFHRGSRWYYYAGLKAYDWLAGQRNMQPARLLSSPQVQRLLPTLRSRGLHGGVAFHDGQFDDARLAMSIARTLAANPQAALLNYAPVVSIQPRGDGGYRAVHFHDQVSSLDHQALARVVVNATGVFAERVSRLETIAGEPPESQPTIQIAPSRGTHLVVSGRFLAGDCALMIPETDDGRVLFAIPWQGHTLIGTTDVAAEHIELEPRAEQSEIDYLLDHLSRYLTAAPQRGDVLSVFSGLRPLLGKSGGQSTARLSREHEIYVSSGGLISIVGGKWTTFRKMGRDVLELAIDVGGLSKLPYREPAIDWNCLVDAQASEAEQQPLSPQLPITARDVRRAVEHEMAYRLEDVLSRRTRCLLLNARAALEVAPQVAQLMCQYSGHDPAWAQTQLAEFSALAQRYTVS